ncbi:MAG TPA: ATPase, T2SS/T4P/T4SS family [bacterium]|nr:ATPase, T2SS/T4P/T4SS family [bacterium]
MNKSQLSRILAEKANLTVVEAEKVINAFADTIGETLKKNQKVIYSNFGTFYTVHYPSKIIYHPILGAKKTMVMEPTDAVKWMPSDNVKALVDKGISVENAVRFGKAQFVTGAKTKKKKVASATKSSTPAILEDEVYEIPIKTHRKVKEIKIEPVASEGQIEVSAIKITPKQPASEKSPAPNESPANGTGNFWDQLFHKAIHDEGHGKKEQIHEAIKKNYLRTKTKNSNTNESPADVDTIPKHESKLGAGVFDKDDQSSVSDLIDIKTRVQDPPAVAKKPDLADKNEKQPTSENIGIASVDQIEKPTQAEKFKSNTQSLPPILSRKTSIKFIDLADISVPKEILGKIPEKIARKYQIVPVEEKDNELVVATVDPENLEAMEIVKKIAMKNISPRLTTRDDLNHIFEQYQGFESEVKEAIDDAVEDEPEEIKTEEKVGKEQLTDSAPAARIVSSLLKRAIRDKASDIHIEPTDTEVVVRYRLDGVLHKKVSLPKDIQLALASRIKILSNLKIDEQRLPQDGRFSINYEGRRVDFRVSTMPTTNGEKVVMRILDKMTGVIAVEKLGFSDRDYKALDESIKKSHGMILVTGPTGSGKTTTLYALLSKIYSEGINIITLEDPIEYQIPGINQSQVNSEIDYTFASGLRSILRQDPDVVMIGEIRDQETAEMAIHAALTGHVVLSTLHTNSASGACPRLTDMGIEPFLLNSSLNLVIGQRLARRICDDCKESETMSSSDLADIKKEIAKMPAEAQKALPKLAFHKGKGCKSCDNTGYRGRIGLYEVLVVSDAIKDLMRKKAPGEEVQKVSMSEGMTTMIQDGISKASLGITTIEEVWRVTKE